MTIAVLVSHIPVYASLYVGEPNGDDSCGQMQHSSIRRLVNTEPYVARKPRKKVCFRS